MGEQTVEAPGPLGRATGTTKPEGRRAPAWEHKASHRARSSMPVTVLPPGTRIGRYEILRLVGQGGMGVVYETHDERLNRRVALKVLSGRMKRSRKAAKRFAIEAQAAARLHHPNVVQIYDFDIDGEFPFIAMEFLKGRTLAALIESGPLSPEHMADVMLGACAGVYAAHQAGIVHRDLKPSNIFLCADFQGRETVRVLDFGVSKVGGLSGSDLTQSGDIVGTSQYLSPEQAAGRRQISHASDQYSLGVVMYECLTQRTPQQGEAMYSLLRNVAEGRHMRLRDLRPDLPVALLAAVERAMRLRPTERFASVYALGRALLSFASLEGHRRFADYYEAHVTEPGSREEASQPRSPEGTRAQPEHATVEETLLPVPDWQERETRTSESRASRRRSSAKRLRVHEAPSHRPPRKLLYSMVVGAVLAVATLGALLLAFGR